MTTKGELNINQNNNNKFRRKNNQRKPSKSVLKNETFNFPCTNRMPMINDPVCYPYCPVSYEPMSLPYSMHPPCYHSRCASHSPSPLNQLRPQDAELEFASLPYVTESCSDSKRRFSDPCIANGFADETGDVLIKSLVEQVNVLNDSNQKLCRELQEVKNEVQFLKQQLNSRFYDREYEPGMLSDIVREIREAARVREEALVSKVKHMIEERHIAMSHLQLMSDRTRTSERIEKLEDQMRSVCLGSSYDDSPNTVSEVRGWEQENVTIRKELQEERSSRKIAEAKLSELERLMTSLKGRTPVGVDSDDPRHLGASSDATATPKRVMTGPVTSL